MSCDQESVSVMCFDSLVSEFRRNGTVLPEGPLSFLRRFVGHGGLFARVGYIMDLITLIEHAQRTNSDVVDYTLEAYKLEIQTKLEEFCRENGDSLAVVLECIRHAHSTEQMVTVQQCNNSVQLEELLCRSPVPSVQQRVVLPLARTAGASSSYSPSSTMAEPDEMDDNCVASSSLVRPPSKRIRLMADVDVNASYGASAPRGIVVNDGRDTGLHANTPLTPDLSFDDIYCDTNVCALGSGSSWDDHLIKFSFVSARGALSRMRLPEDVTIIKMDTGRQNVELRFKCIIATRMFSEIVYAYSEHVAEEMCARLFLDKLKAVVPTTVVPSFTRDDRLLVDPDIFYEMEKSHGFPGLFTTRRVRRLYKDGRPSHLVYKTLLEIPVLFDGRRSTVTTHDESPLYLYAKKGAARKAYSILFGIEYPCLRWQTAAPSGIVYGVRRPNDVIVLSAAAA